MRTIGKNNKTHDLLSKQLRIATLTLNGYFNYGNVLQRYALCQILLRYTCKVDSIWWEKDNFLPCSWKWGWKENIKYIINWKNFRHHFAHNQFGWEMVRQFSIRRFCQQYIDIRYINQPLDSLRKH